MMGRKVNRGEIPSDAATKLLVELGWDFDCDPTHNTQHQVYQATMPDLPWESLGQRKQLNAFLSDAIVRGKLVCTRDELRAEAARLACKSCKSLVEDAMDRFVEAKSSSVCPSLKMTKAAGALGDSCRSGEGALDTSEGIVKPQETESQDDEGSLQAISQELVNVADLSWKIEPVGGGISSSQLEQLQEIVKMSAATPESLSLSGSDRLVALLAEEGGSSKDGHDMAKIMETLSFADGSGKKKNKKKKRKKAVSVAAQPSASVGRLIPHTSPGIVADDGDVMGQLEGGGGGGDDEVMHCLERTGQEAVWSEGTKGKEGKVDGNGKRREGTEVSKKLREKNDAGNGNDPKQSGKERSTEGDTSEHEGQAAALRLLGGEHAGHGAVQTAGEWLREKLASLVQHYRGLMEAGAAADRMSELTASERRGGRDAGLSAAGSGASNSFLEYQLQHQAYKLPQLLQTQEAHLRQWLHTLTELVRSLLRLEACLTLVAGQSREVLSRLIKCIYAQYEKSIEELMQVHIQGRKAMLRVLPATLAQEFFIILNYPAPPEARHMSARHLEEKRRIVLRLHELVAQYLLPQSTDESPLAAGQGLANYDGRRTRALLERYMHLGHDPMGFFKGDFWDIVEKKEEKCYNLRVSLLAGTQPKSHRTEILQEAQEHETALRATVTEWEGKLQDLFEATSAAFEKELAVSCFPQSLEMAEALRGRQRAFIAEWEAHREGYKFQVTLSQERLQEVYAANHEEKLRLRQRNEAALVAEHENSTDARKHLPAKDTAKDTRSGTDNPLPNGGKEGPNDGGKGGKPGIEAVTAMNMNSLLQQAQLQQLEQCLAFRVVAVRHMTQRLRLVRGHQAFLKTNLSRRAIVTRALCGQSSDAATKMRLLLARLLVQKLGSAYGDWQATLMEQELSAQEERDKQQQLLKKGGGAHSMTMGKKKGSTRVGTLTGKAALAVNGRASSLMGKEGLAASSSSAGPVFTGTEPTAESFCCLDRGDSTQAGPDRMEGAASCVFLSSKEVTKPKGKGGAEGEMGNAAQASFLSSGRSSLKESRPLQSPSWIDSQGNFLTSARSLAHHQSEAAASGECDGLELGWIRVSSREGRHRALTRKEEKRHEQLQEDATLAAEEEHKVPKLRPRDQREEEQRKESAQERVKGQHGVEAGRLSLRIYRGEGNGAQSQSASSPWTAHSDTNAEVARIIPSSSAPPSPPSTNEERPHETREDPLSSSKLAATSTHATNLESVDNFSKTAFKVDVRGGSGGNGKALKEDDVVCKDGNSLGGRDLQRATGSDAFDPGKAVEGNDEEDEDIGDVEILFGAFGGVQETRGGECESYSEGCEDFQIRSGGPEEQHMSPIDVETPVRMSHSRGNTQPPMDDFSTQPSQPLLQLPVAERSQHHLIAQRGRDVEMDVAQDQSHRRHQDDVSSSPHLVACPPSHPQTHVGAQWPAVPSFHQPLPDVNGSITAPLARPELAHSGIYPTQYSHAMGKVHPHMVEGGGLPPNHPPYQGYFPSAPSPYFVDVPPPNTPIFAVYSHDLGPPLVYQELQSGQRREYPGSGTGMGDNHLTSTQEQYGPPHQGRQHHYSRYAEQGCSLYRQGFFDGSSPHPSRLRHYQGGGPPSAVHPAYSLPVHHAIDVQQRPLPFAFPRVVRNSPCRGNPVFTAAPPYSAISCEEGRLPGGPRALLRGATEAGWRRGRVSRGRGDEEGGRGHARGRATYSTAGRNARCQGLPPSGEGETSSSNKQDGCQHSYPVPISGVGAQAEEDTEIARQLVVERVEGSHEAGIATGAHLSHPPKQESRVKLPSDRIKSPSNRSQAGSRVLVGGGLANRMGQNHCYLNVVVQSLWSIRAFRNRVCRDTDTSMLVKSNETAHMCKLHEALRAVMEGLSDQEANIASHERGEDTTIPPPVVSVDKLRQVLSEMVRQKSNPTPACGSEIYVHDGKFRAGHMDDAVEAFEEILRLLGTGGEEGRLVVRDSFCLHLRELMFCPTCGSSSPSPARDYDTNVFYVPVRSLIEEAARRASSKSNSISISESVGLDFGSLLQDAGSGDLYRCRNTEACPIARRGEKRAGHRYLVRGPPSVFSLGLVWDSLKADPRDTQALIDLLSSTICLKHFKLPVEHQGDDDVEQQGEMIGVLRGFFAFHPQKHHYVSFLLYDGTGWVCVDDGRAYALGPHLSDALKECTEQQYQPSLLFYEAN